MKQKRTIFAAFLAIMLLACSFSALAAARGQVIAAGSVTLEKESEASRRLIIEGDTESHTDSDLVLKIYLDFKPTENGSVTTQSWNYTKADSSLLTKSRTYTATAAGYYRLRGFHSATLSGVGTESLTSETEWIYVR